ncbi:hypothetical protein V491_07413, partial [Pseudogymnoascus sp. VKM F-3775]
GSMPPIELAQIGIPEGETVMVPRAVKQLYTLSPENPALQGEIKSSGDQGQSGPATVVGIRTSEGLAGLDLFWVKNSKKKLGGRGQLQSGGELRASDAYELQAQKDELQAQKLATTEARKLHQAQNRARKQLHWAGIEAWKQERLWKKSLAQLTELGLLIPPELEDPITDPEAEPQS